MNEDQLAELLYAFWRALPWQWRIASVAFGVAWCGTLVYVLLIR